MMGMCYKDAHGVETDYDEAFRWFKSSAQKGNMRAMCMLGEAYKFGQGTEEDLAKAIYYYEQGASGGDALSQYALSRHYLV
jgi:TPR repeat protein